MKPLLPDPTVSPESPVDLHQRTRQILGTVAFAGGATLVGVPLVLLKREATLLSSLPQFTVILLVMVMIFIPNFRFGWRALGIVVLTLWLFSYLSAPLQGPVPLVVAAVLTLVTVGLAGHRYLTAAQRSSPFPGLPPPVRRGPVLRSLGELVVFWLSTPASKSGQHSVTLTLCTTCAWGVVCSQQLPFFPDDGLPLTALTEPGIFMALDYVRVNVIALTLWLSLTFLYLLTPTILLGLCLVLVIPTAQKAYGLLRLQSNLAGAWDQLREQLSAESSEQERKEE